MKEIYQQSFVWYLLRLKSVSQSSAFTHKKMFAMKGMGPSKSDNCNYF